MSEQWLTIQDSKEVTEAWSRWINVTRQRCHLNFSLEGDSLKSHIERSISTSNQTACRVSKEIPSLPKKILEVGSSTGFNCLSMAAIFPYAQVLGLEPDSDAVAVALAMRNSSNLVNVDFIQGHGESLPFEDNQFDLIFCHTVIEHVQDPEKVVSEMARVLAPKGVLLLEAPNYLFPYEPHLGIWCIPILGKSFVKAMAVLQGKSSQIGYLAHLKFVTPPQIERYFQKSSLEWTSRVPSKLKNIFEGDGSHVVSYRRSATFLRLLSKGRLGKTILKFITKTHLYPSMLYTAQKASSV